VRNRRKLGLLIPCPICKQIASCADGHHICLKCEGERP
jgi:hypothetical protein